MLAVPRRRASAQGWVALINNERVRAVVYQVATAAVVVALVWWFASNAAANMADRGMSAGFGFLDSSAGFGIGFTLIPYQEGNTYLRVFLVGITNTLLVAVIAIAAATLLGLV
ncbi:MAG: amino acid ABC transporter permease, partial [Pseudomonadota bacterium]